MCLSHRPEVLQIQSLPVLVGLYKCARVCVRVCVCRNLCAKSRVFARFRAHSALIYSPAQVEGRHSKHKQEHAHLPFRVWQGPSHCPRSVVVVNHGWPLPSESAHRTCAGIGHH